MASLANTVFLSEENKGHLEAVQKSDSYKLGLDEVPSNYKLGSVPPISQTADDEGNLSVEFPSIQAVLMAYLLGKDETELDEVAEKSYWKLKRAIRDAKAFFAETATVKVYGKEETLGYFTGKPLFVYGGQ